jgi:hypothetical protein
LDFDVFGDVSREEREENGINNQETESRRELPTAEPKSAAKRLRAALLAGSLGA